VIRATRSIPPARRIRSRWAQRMARMNGSIAGSSAMSLPFEDTKRHSRRERPGVVSHGGTVDRGLGSVQSNRAARAGAVGKDRMKEAPQPATRDHRSAGAGSHKPCPGAPGTSQPEGRPCVARCNGPREVVLGARGMGCGGNLLSSSRCTGDGRNFANPWHRHKIWIYIPYFKRCFPYHELFSNIRLGYELGR